MVNVLGSKVLFAAIAIIGLSIVAIFAQYGYRLNNIQLFLNYVPDTDNSIIMDNTSYTTTADDEIENANITNCTGINNSDSIHIVMSTDISQIQGLLALLQSLKMMTRKRFQRQFIVQHLQLTHLRCSDPSQRCIENFLLHVDLMETPPDRLLLYYRIQHYLPRCKVNIVEFNIPNEIEQLITITSKSRHYLKSPANFARFYFSELFPRLSHIIYLDVDMIVQHDISELWNLVVKSEKLIVAANRMSHQHISNYLNASSIKEIYMSRYNKELNFQNLAFNAGVVGFNLQKWRSAKITDELVYWMEQHKQHNLWELGTQPIMFVLVGDDVEFVDKRWNVEGLGWNLALKKKFLTGAFILHWNGKRKPWKKLPGSTRYSLYWKKYLNKKCIKQ